jgi:hypothetical protein
MGWMTTGGKNEWKEGKIDGRVDDNDKLPGLL